MFEELERAAADLANTRAGWVVRRDGAELLGRAAAQALAALKAHAEEPDVDVRRSVSAALSEASAGLTGIAPQVRGAGLDEVAKYCEKPGSREVEASGEGYAIRVHLASGRHQTVYLMPYKRKDGIALVRAYTHCGPPDAKTIPWVLQANMKLAQCAFGVIEEDGKELLVLSRCYLASEVTPREVKVAVKEIAHYGDLLESQLTEVDTL